MPLFSTERTKVLVRTGGLFSLLGLIVCLAGVGVATHIIRLKGGIGMAIVGAVAGFVLLLIGLYFIWGARYLNKRDARSSDSR